VSAATTSIARLACRIEVPEGVADPRELQARLARLPGDVLASALSEALDDLDGVDRGALWIIRRLGVSVAVPAGERSAERQGARLAGALAEAIRRAVRAGPGGDVVRFADRVDYAGAFVAARLEGADANWVFDTLDGLRPLPPAAALRECATRLGVGVVEVVAAVGARGGLLRLVSSAAPAELERLWAACLRPAGAAIVPPDDVRERVTAALAAAAPASAFHPRAAARALLAVGVVAPAFGIAAEVVAAVAAVTATPSASVPAGPSDTAQTTGALTRVGRRQAAPMDARARPRPDGDPAESAQEVICAAGASTFLALPSLEAVGLGELPAAGRAEVLRAMLGLVADPPDPALALAAGADDHPRPARAALLAALVADDRVEGELLVTTVVKHDGRDVALVRDAREDLWLAGAVLPAGAAPPWAALIADVEAALGRAPGAVTADDAALGARPAAIDVAWLAPADDAGLALGLMARAGLQHLGRRLLGFGRATMPYLVERFVPPGGWVTPTAAALLVELPPPPLQVVLTIAGLDAFAYRVGWLDRDVVVRHEEA
jgi:hypothetical protein